MDGGKRGSLKTKPGAPMTEAQKEYIILEGEIEEVFSFLDDAPEFTREIEGDIRSRPYKSEAVLIRREWAMPSKNPKKSKPHVDAEVKELDKSNSLEEDKTRNETTVTSGKSQETAAPPAPFAAAMKAKFTQPENKPGPVAPVTTGQPIKPEHAVILSVAYCQAKKCEHLLPCKERGGRIECFPAGAEPRHMNECPIEKRKRIAQEQGFGTAADYDPTNGAKFIKHPPYKITKAPMTIHFEPSSKQQVFIETALKSGKFDTSEQVLSQALDLWMDQEGA
jgi:hypothetical protein